MKNQNKLSIIIPVYNESATVELILEKVNSVSLINNIEKEIVIVNDASTDNSKVLITAFKDKHKDKIIKYFEHEINKGKGVSIQKGILESTGDYIIIQDADLEYNPEDYNILLECMINDNADVVYGSRFKGHNSKETTYLLHYIGNRLLTFLSNLFSKVKLTDMETCYKLFKADILKSIPLSEKRFGFEPEITAKINRIHDIKIEERGISYVGRPYSEGKKITWKDGVRTIYCIAKYGLFKLN